MDRVHGVIRVRAGSKQLACMHAQVGIMALLFKGIDPGARVQIPLQEFINYILLIMFLYVDLTTK